MNSSPPRFFKSNYYAFAIALLRRSPKLVDSNSFFAQLIAALRVVNLKVTQLTGF